MENKLLTGIESLKSFLDQFKFAFDSPKDYLQYFFNDIREKLEYETKIMLELQKNGPFFVVYNKMIHTNKEKIFNKIKSFENECLENLEKLKTDGEFWKRIACLIVNNISQIDKFHENKFRELYFLIEDSFDEFRKSLFLDKTLGFLNTVSIIKINYRLPNNEAYFGRLAFANIYLSRKVRLKLFNLGCLIENCKTEGGMEEFDEILINGNIHIWLLKLEKFHSTNIFMDNKVNSDFKGLTLLKSVVNLKWRMGKFPNLRADSLNGLINLKELDLRSNSIKFIAENTFIGLSKLKKLVIDENNLEMIKSSTFNGLYSLTILHLENNEIKTIEPYSFIGLSALPRLTLQNNKLDSLCSNIFIGLSSLNELNLENNQINLIEPSSFLGLFNLKILLLGKNRLRELDENSFYGLCNLKYLDLTRNEINSIRKNTFYKLPELSHLYLLGNKLSHIDNLNKPQNLIYIDLNQILTEEKQQCSTFNGSFIK